MVKRSERTSLPVLLLTSLVLFSLILSSCNTTAVTGVPVSGGVPASGSLPTLGGQNRSSYAAYLPNPQMTPGDTLDVTKADICEPGYSSKVRNVPQSVKNQAYQEYGILSHKAGEYEVDHLISLELGGSNSIKNLWPESYSGPWNAHIKDKLENKLHELVCSGSLDLTTAQHDISTDWIAAYQKYVGQ